MRAALPLACLAILAASAPSYAATDWKKVESAMGRPGMEQPGGVHRFGLPRSDLQVTLDGVAIKPTLALGSWVAFKDIDDRSSAVMGDLVLTEEEVEPAMKRLAEGGIAITALHNHLLRSRPATLYMHVGGHGDAVAMAETIHAALALGKTPLAAPPGPAQAQPVDLETDALDRIVGHKGKAAGGVYQFSVPRAEPIAEGGMEVPDAMGTGTALNFQPTGGGKAAVTGDFVLLGTEVNPVLRTLRENGIEVTALHNHMLDDRPRLFFMHFWANDDAQKLAQGLRAALDRMNVARSHEP